MSTINNPLTLNDKKLIAEKTGVSLDDLKNLRTPPEVEAENINVMFFRSYENVLKWLFDEASEITIDDFVYITTISTYELIDKGYNNLSEMIMDNYNVAKLENDTYALFF